MLKIKNRFKELRYATGSDKKLRIAAFFFEIDVQPNCSSVIMKLNESERKSTKFKITLP